MHPFSLFLAAIENYSGQVSYFPISEFSYKLIRFFSKVYILKYENHFQLNGKKIHNPRSSSMATSAISSIVAMATSFAREYIMQVT